MSISVLWHSSDPSVRQKKGIAIRLFLLHSRVLYCMIAPPMEEKHRFLTVEETAKELRISRATLYILMKNKRIRVAKIGGRTYIDRTDLEDFIEKSKTEIE